MALAFLGALHSFRSTPYDSDFASRRGGDVRPKAPNTPSTPSKPESAPLAMTYDAKTKTMHVTVKGNGKSRSDVLIDQKGDHVTVTVKRSDEPGTRMKTTKFEHSQVKNLDIQTGEGDDFISTSRPSRSRSDTSLTDPKADDNHANKNVTVNLKVDAGGGNDLVIGSNGKNTINGGRGHDRLIGGKSSDAIDAGAGDDYIEGAAGNDRLQGGKNKDVIYGNRGKDEIVDKQGAFNYLEGGKDNDHITSGGSRNTVSAGRGDDIVDSLGIDTIYTGAGKDKVNDLGGRKDTIYAQTGEDTIDKGKSSNPTVVDVGLKIEEQVTTRLRVAVDGVLDGLWRFGTGECKTVIKLGAQCEMVTPGRAVRIEGSAEFKDRMEDDIDMLRSSPTGQSMLKALDESWHTVSLGEPPIERDYGNAFAMRKDGGELDAVSIKEGGAAGQQKDAMVVMHPSIGPTLGDLGWFPGPTILFHEFSHAYNFVTGTAQPGIYSGKDGHDSGIKNAERQAVGLPTEGIPHDFDRNILTAPTTNSPFNLTENGLRSEMNVPLRSKYDH